MTRNAFRDCSEIQCQPPSNFRGQLIQICAPWHSTNFRGDCHIQIRANQSRVGIQRRYNTIEYCVIAALAFEWLD